MDKLAEANSFTTYRAACTAANCYESPDFSDIKYIAESTEENQLFFYCHSKGAANRKIRAEGVFRVHTTLNLAYDTNVLVIDSKVNKAGLYPSAKGYLRKNFSGFKLII